MTNPNWKGKRGPKKKELDYQTEIDQMMVFIARKLRPKAKELKCGHSLAYALQTLRELKLTMIYNEKGLRKIRGEVVK